MRNWLLLAAACALCACTDDPPLENALDASVAPDSSTPDSSAPLTHCLERPGELPRPPAGRLPCELIPPGLVL